MARNEDIVNSIWEDLDDLSNDEMMLFVWSWTNSRCGMAGIYKCARRNLVEGRIGDEALTAALAELSRRRLLFYEDSVVWNRPRVKRLRQKGQKIAPAIAKDLKDLSPDHPLYIAFMQEYGHEDWLQDAFSKHGVSIALGSTIDALSIPLPDGSTEANPDGVSEPHRWAPGTGTGQGTTNSDLSQLVDEILAKLVECDRWTVNPIETRVQVENAIASFPDADHMQAARDAVVWGLRGNYRNRNAGTAFLTALQKMAERGQRKGAQPGRERPSATEWDALADELEAAERKDAA